MNVPFVTVTRYTKARKKALLILVDSNFVISGGFYGVTTNSYILIS